MTDDSSRIAASTSNGVARKYDAVAYAAQANALSHPRHVAAVCALFGLTTPDIATARVLEVGCSDGSNLLPMAAALPRASFVGVDLSGNAVADARRGADELALKNVTFQHGDLSTAVDGAGAFDYIIAYGLYSWVPQSVRDALLSLAARRLAPNGALFVSYNVYPGCHLREAAWRTLHHHVDHITDARGKLDAARSFAALLAEPGGVQAETDALLRDEFRKLSVRPDSALFHDDLAVPNDPFYFHEFVAQLERYELVFLAEAQLSMMTSSGVSPRMRQFVAGMDRLAREQYLDFARMRRFRQSIICRRGAAGDSPGEDQIGKIGSMYVAASMTFIQSSAARKASTVRTGTDDPESALANEVLQRLVAAAPRIFPVAEVVSWPRGGTPHDDATVYATLIKAWYDGNVELYLDPPELTASPGDRPEASAVVRWQAGRQRSVTTLRHQTMRIDDPVVLALLRMLDGTRTREELAQALAPHLPATDQSSAGARIDSYLPQLALHGLLIA